MLSQRRHAVAHVCSFRIESIEPILANLKRGDYVFFDIDETLLLTGENKYHDQVKLTEAHLTKTIRTLQESHIKTIGLTAREVKNTGITEIQLEQVGIYLDDIIHAPFTRTEGNKYANKGIALRDYIKKINRPSRIFVIDDNKRQHVSIYKRCKEFGIPLFLYHYQRPIRLRLQDEHDIQNFFPPDLDEFVKLTFLGGGTASTYLIQHVYSDKQYVLKYGVSEEAIKLEILSNIIYRMLGVKVPKIAVYNTLPSRLTDDTQCRYRLVQLSEYITPHLTNCYAELIKKISQQARKDFIAHAWLGNIDFAKLDNHIVDQEGNVYLIDAGSNFINRALGKERKENPHFATEVDSLRNININQQAHQWFHDLTDQEIKYQIVAIQHKFLDIEASIWDCAVKLNLSGAMTIQFLQELINRLDYLSTRFCPEQMSRAKIDKLADVNCTSAGILTYTIINDQAHVLLAKRAQHEWWDNFGGKSEAQDEYLYTTAVREVAEESNQQIIYSNLQLINSPSHDLVTGEQGSRRVYRMYIAKHQHIPEFDKFTDKEHTEYSWVAITALLAALDEPQVTMENKKTVVIKLGDKVIVLYPALYHMLCQFPVKNNLLLLSQGKPIKVTHTQGVADLCFEYHTGMRVLRSSTVMRSQLNHALIRHSAVMRQLKDKNMHILLEDEADKKNSRFSHSEFYLRAMLGKNYTENNLLNNISTFLKNVDKKISSHAAESLNELCALMIGEEEKLSTDYLVCYHGCSNQVAFAYTVYTEFHKILRLNTDWAAFRSNHFHFQPFKNVADFIKFYSKNGTQEINNDQAGFHECALSTNLFLFGNHACLTSNSLYYFMNNDSRRGINLSSLLTNIFNDFTISKQQIHLLVEYYHQYFAKLGGFLFQIAVPHRAVEDLIYPAKTLGCLSLYKHIQNPLLILKALRSDFALEPEKACEYMQRFQMRLMVPPHQFFKVKSYALNHISSLENEKTSDLLQNLIEKLAFDLLASLNQKTIEHFYINTPLLLLANQVYAKNNLSLAVSDKSITSVLAKAILTDNEILLVKILTDYPELRFKILDVPPAYLSGFRSEQNLTTLEMIINSNMDKDSLIEKFYPAATTLDQSNTFFSELNNAEIFHDFLKRGSLLAFDVAWQLVMAEKKLQILDLLDTEGTPLISLLAKNNSATIPSILHSLTEQELNALLQMTFKNGLRLLEIAAEFCHPNTLLMIFTLYKKFNQDHSDMPISIDATHLFFLSLQKNGGAFLGELAKMLSEEEKHDIILKKNSEGDTLLHIAFNKADDTNFIGLLGMLTNTSILNVLFAENDNGCSLLKLVTSKDTSRFCICCKNNHSIYDHSSASWSLLHDIFKLLIQRHLVFDFYKNCRGKIWFDLAISARSQFFDAIRLLPANTEHGNTINFSAFIMQRDDKKQNILHIMIQNCVVSRSLTDMLGAVTMLGAATPDLQYAMLTAQDETGNTPLDLLVNKLLVADDFSKYFKQLLMALDSSIHAMLFNRICYKGLPLHVWLFKHKVKEWREIIDFFDGSTMLAIIENKDTEKKNFFHHLVGLGHQENSDYFATYLGRNMLFKHLFLLFYVQDNSGEKSIQTLIRNKMEQFLIKILSADLIITQIKEYSKNYNKIFSDYPMLLHFAVQDRDVAFTAIWRNLSDSTKLIVSQYKCSGFSLLELAAQKSHPESWQTLWQYYSNLKHFAAQLHARYAPNDDSLLHLALHHSHRRVFSWILKALPEKERFSALIQRNKQGISPINLILEKDNSKSKFKLIILMLKQLPVNARLKVLLFQAKQNSSLLKLITSEYKESYQSITELLNDADKKYFYSAINKLNSPLKPLWVTAQHSIFSGNALTFFMLPNNVLATVLENNLTVDMAFIKN